MSESFLNPSEPYEPWSRCPHFGTPETRALIASNGVIHVKRYCPDCDMALTGAITHKGIDVDALPVHADYRQTDAPCERCDATLGAEVHHWAPRHLFDDCDLWPVGHLCRDCHTRWHQIVTPDMGRRRAS